MSRFTDGTFKEFDTFSETTLFTQKLLVELGLRYKTSCLFYTEFRTHYLLQWLLNILLFKNIYFKHRRICQIRSSFP